MPFYSLELESNYNRNPDSKIHWSIRPHLTSELNKYINISDTSVLNLGFSDSLNKSFLRLDPILNLSLGYDFSHGNSSFINENEGGFQFQYNIDTSFSVCGYFRGGISRFSNPVSQFIKSNRVIPGTAIVNQSKQTSSFSFYDYGINLNFKLNKFLSLSGGVGDLFIGEGYRSIFLSDNAPNYPYAQLKLNFLNLEYVSSYQFLTDLKIDDNGSIDTRPKYSTSHILSWNALSWLNLMVFESVVWRGENSAGRRGFDFYYLNPVIFLRPVEYNIGSSDNMLLGAGGSVRINKSFRMYGYFLFDEFNYQILKQRNGWWANKFAIQAGFKWFNILQVSGLHVQLEFNTARPYMYSHGDSYQNYGHERQALSHSLGANFYEGLMRIYYTTGNWRFENLLNVYAKGYDISDSTSYGGDINKSYTLRENEYGNKTLQGDKQFRLRNYFEAQYVLNSEINLMVFSGVQLRWTNDNGGNDWQGLFNLGFRTKLFNRYLNHF